MRHACTPSHFRTSRGAVCAAGPLLVAAESFGAAGAALGCRCAAAVAAGRCARFNVRWLAHSDLWMAAQTRLTMKYRHCDGKLEFKVTDDRVCLKYCTEQMQDLKKMEKLNNSLMQLLTQ
eukprot:m.25814 g.25814  ORF g.25814 m.25814 type:complete len:120 (-) comp4485_c0_seq1:22-381(-)